MTRTFVTTNNQMLRKIDCIMIRVENVEAAAAYYAKVFGLQPHWSGDGSIGLVFPESDTEIVLHSDPNIPSSVEVYYLVDDAVAAVEDYTAQGSRCSSLLSTLPLANVRSSRIRSAPDFVSLIRRRECGRPTSQNQPNGWTDELTAAQIAPPFDLSCSSKSNAS
jgi:predicted enzyme related to lactoylglutathione lyase